VPGCAHAFHSDLTRPICVIEGGEVTGRALEMGTTTLLVDLMRRVATPGLGVRGVASPFVVGYVDIGFAHGKAAVFSGINYPF
jgi:hypothetical protein